MCVALLRMAELFLHTVRYVMKGYLQCVHNYFNLACRIIAKVSNENAIDIDKH